MFASFLSFIAVLGVALGVFALVTVLSVMRGFRAELEQRLIGFNAHVVVTPAQSKEAELEKIPGVLGNRIESSAVMIDGEGIIETTAGEKTAQGVKIRGMDADDLQKLKGTDFFVPDHIKQPGLVIGSELAYQLGVHPDFGDKVVLVVPLAGIGPTGDFVPKRLASSVDGMFRSGYFEHDGKTVIIPMKEANALLGGLARPSLHIWLKSFRSAPTIADIIKKNFPDVKVATWTQSNRKLFAALNLERMAMTVLLLLMIVIASISIVSIIFMYVFLRRKDIAILSSIGADKKQVRNIFVRIGAMIGAIGGVIGVIMAGAFCVWLEKKSIPLPASYYLDHLPVDISWAFAGGVVVCAVVVAIVAAFYPATTAASLRPCEVLRYE
jgi:lipoprotein-releasing system permease protein